MNAVLAAAPVQHSGSGGSSWVVIAIVFAVALGAALPLVSLTSLRRFYAAERALAENQIAEYEAGVTENTPEWRRLSREAAEADRAVPRWLGWARQPVWRRIERELDYRRRTGQS